MSVINVFAYINVITVIIIILMLLYIKTSTNNVSNLYTGIVYAVGLILLYGTSLISGVIVSSMTIYNDKV